MRFGVPWPFARRRERATCFQKEALLGEQRLIGVELGVVQVPVSAIIGEVVWCQRPKAPSLGLAPGAFLSRLLRSNSPLAEAAPASLLKIGVQYYVDRGHGQVRDAVRRRRNQLQAHVVDYVRTSGDVTGLLQRAHAEFAHKSGIAEVHLNSPESYASLLGQIAEHQSHLERKRGQLFMPSDAIADWLQRLYRPVIAGLELDGVLDEFPGLSAGDAYMYLTTFLESRASEQDIPLSDALEHVLASRASWQTRMASIVPPCVMEGPCPY